MATGTRLKVKRLTGIYSRLENDAMAEAVLDNLKLFGAPRPTKKDAALVKKLGKKPEFGRGIDTGPERQARGSSDEDNVSWLAPFGRFCVACVSAEGVPAHHRDYAAQMKLPFAHKGLLRAAEVFAGAAVDVASKKGLLKKAAAEFKRRTKGFRYDPLVPKKQKPPSIAP